MARPIDDATAKQLSDDAHATRRRGYRNRWSRYADGQWWELDITTDLQYLTDRDLRTVTDAEWRKAVDTLRSTAHYWARNNGYKVQVRKHPDRRTVMLRFTRHGEIPPDRRQRGPRAKWHAWADGNWWRVRLDTDLGYLPTTRTGDPVGYAQLRIAHTRARNAAYSWARLHAYSANAINDPDDKLAILVRFTPDPTATPRTPRTEDPR